MPKTKQPNRNNHTTPKHNKTTRPNIKTNSTDTDVSKDTGKRSPKTNRDGKK